MSEKGGMPIARRLRSIFYTLGFLFVLIGAAIHGISDYSRVEDDYAAELKRSAAICEGMLRDYLFRLLPQMDRLAASLLAEDITPERIMERLRDFGSDVIPYVLDETGRLIAIHGSYRGLLGLDFSRLDHIRQSDYAVSPIHQSFFTKRPVLTISRPLPSGMLLLVEQPLEPVLGIVSNLNAPDLERKISYFILTGEGTVVFHPDRSLVESRHNLAHEMTDMSNPGHEGLVTYRLRGARYKGFISRFAIPEGWSFYASVPVSVFRTGIMKTTAISTLHLILLYLASLLVIEHLLSREIARPISLLAGTIARMNPLSGERIPVDAAGRSKESVIIIDAVNCMAERTLADHHKLETERRLFRKTIENIDEGIFVTDLAGNVILMNFAAESITGWTFDEARGRPIRELCDACAAKKDSIPPGSCHVQCEITIHPRGGGPEKTVLVTSSPIDIFPQEDLGSVIAIRDITMERSMEAERQKTANLSSLGVLAGGIAHDFNNILTAILGNVSLVKMGMDPSSKTYTRLEAAETATYRAQDLARQLLTFAKGGEPVKEKASILEIIKESSAFSLSGSNCWCQVEKDGDIPPIDIDSNQMSQVFRNLILNAAQAMPDGGKISIRAGLAQVDGTEGLPIPPGRYASIRVADTGVGIPRENLARIFDPYFTTKQMGSGLGLATSYSIIKRHGGHISVESTPGKGTVFTIHLPVKVPTPENVNNGIAPGTEGHAASPETSAKILVMDDDEVILNLSEEAIESLGYDADSAKTGEEAIDKYRRAMEAGQPFSMVIIDLTVKGGMGGKDAAREILVLDPGARLIVSSGYAGDPVMANFREHGFSGVLAKPYKIGQLEKVLASVLRKNAPEGRVNPSL